MFPRAASFLKLLPPPLRFGLVALAGFAAFSLARQAGWWLVAAAAALWLVVVLGIVHRLGLAAGLTGSPRAKPLLDRLLGPAAPAGPGHGEPVAGPAAVDPGTAYAAAYDSIAGLAGIDDARRGLGNLEALIAAAELRGQRGFGTGMPGIAILLVGPNGTGKTTVARALPGLLFGRRAIDRPEVVELAPHDVGAHPAEASARAEARAAQSAGGVLLVDDAEWLCSASRGATPVGREVGAGVLRAAARRPGEITLVMTGGPALDARLEADAEQAGWLKKLHVVRIDFEALSERDLVAVFDGALDRGNARLDAQARTDLIPLVRAEIRSGGDDFANAVAMQRLAARAIEAASHRLQDGDWDEGALTITARDVRTLQTA